uniref:Uncharacterized protein n=1 Tax=Oryza glumipatula TaxID=40148 RepID=A0A0E0BBV6_9ORYZ
MAASGKEVDASNNSGKPRWLAAMKGSDHSGGVGAFSLGAWRCKGVARQSASMCCGQLDHSFGMHDDGEVWLRAGPCSDIAGIVRWSSRRIWGPELKLGRIAPSSWAATTADRPLCPILSHLLGAPTLLGWFIGRKELHGETVKMAAGEEGRGCRHVAVGGGLVVVMVVPTCSIGSSWLRRHQIDHMEASRQRGVSVVAVVCWQGYRQAKSWAGSGDAFGHCNPPEGVVEVPLSPFLMGSYSR